MGIGLRKHLQALFLAAVLAFTAPAYAFNFQVTDNAASCTSCDPSDCSNCGNPAGTCPFQDALNIAACNGEADTITLAAGTYNSDAAGPTECGGDSGFCYDADEASDGSSLTITGAGVGQTFIDGMNASGGLIIDGDNQDEDMVLTISGITIRNCDTDSMGGGLQVSVNDADVNIFENEFVNNRGEGGGGARMSGSGGAFTLNRNAFIDNLSEGGEGGGLDAYVQGGSYLLTNNVFVRNTSTTSEGGGANLETAFGTIRVIHNSFYDNEAQDGEEGGGLHVAVCGEASADIYNNILYLNTAGGPGDDLYAGILGCEINTDAIVTVNDNDFIQFDFQMDSALTIVQNFNINQDPLWADRDNANLRLTALSPVIDQGDLNPPGGLPTPDFDGVTRPQGPLPDMGAFEFQATATPTPTPIPTPTPTATPTPSLTPTIPVPPSSLFLQGSGTVFGCSLNQLGRTSPKAVLLWLGLLALAAITLHGRKTL